MGLFVKNQSRITSYNVCYTKLLRYLAEQGYTIATLGDMYRVPGSKKSLMELQSEGADVRIVYGIPDAVKLAKKQNEKVIFVAIGFETTAVITSYSIHYTKLYDTNYVARRWS